MEERAKHPLCEVLPLLLRHLAAEIAYMRRRNRWLEKSERWLGEHADLWRDTGEGGGG